MTYTIAQARTQLLSHLDDDGSRWSVTEQDNALSFALAGCQGEYASAGGNRFETETQLSSDTNGQIAVDLFAEPLAIRGVAMIVGNRNFPIREVKPEQRNLTDTQARNWIVRYVKRMPYENIDPNNQLVDNTRTWDSFENWVILRAAVFASVKDGRARPELLQMEQMAKDAVMLEPLTPKAILFPGPPAWYSGWFTWYWRPDLAVIQVCRRV